MPWANKLAVPAFKRPAEMQTDISDRADAFAGAIDMHLPAKERRNDSAGFRNFGDLADFVSHGVNPFSIPTSKVQLLAYSADLRRGLMRSAFIWQKLKDAEAQLEDKKAPQ